MQMYRPMYLQEGELYGNVHLAQFGDSHLVSKVTLLTRWPVLLNILVHSNQETTAEKKIHCRNAKRKATGDPRALT